MGLAILIGGIVLLVMGLNASESVAESVHESVTGRYTDTTTWYIVGGIAGIIVGGGLAMFGGRLSRA